MPRRTVLRSAGPILTRPLGLELEQAAKLAVSACKHLDKLDAKHAAAKAELVELVEAANALNQKINWLDGQRRTLRADINSNLDMLMVAIAAVRERVPPPASPTLSPEPAPESHDG